MWSCWQLWELFGGAQNWCQQACVPRLCVGGEGCHFQEPLPGVFSLLFASGPRTVSTGTRLPPRAAQPQNPSAAAPVRGGACLLSSRLARRQRRPQDQSVGGGSVPPDGPAGPPLLMTRLPPVRMGRGPGHAQSSLRGTDTWTSAVTPSLLLSSPRGEEVLVVVSGLRGRSRCALQKKGSGGVG